jgi:hypothetical protein
MIDMGEVKKITISGFRGINRPPLELDFQNGKSMMIYGTNGTGKSSIVDAWEWLYSGKIMHLARENAKEHAYPHKEAGNDQTWVKVDFTRSEIGEIVATFNLDKITHPFIEGNYSEIKKVVSHPCHLRYRDLTEFVYATKGKKYEFLSSQMGFGDAIKIQNDLKKGSTRLNEKSIDLKRDLEFYKKEYCKISGEEPKSIESHLKILNNIFYQQDIEYINELSELNIKLENLKEKVENDEKSKNLSYWKTIEQIINQIYPIENICPDVSDFQYKLVEFKKDENKISKLILLDLYEKGLGAIESLKAYDECPLCDQYYGGNLVEYIEHKQKLLKELNTIRMEIEEKKKNLNSSINEIIKKLDYASNNLSQLDLESPIVHLNENINNTLTFFKECNIQLEKKVEDINTDFDFINKIDTNEFNSLLNSQEEITESISIQIDELEKNEYRKKLVSDCHKLHNLSNYFSKWYDLNRSISYLIQIKDEYEKIKGDYIEETKRNVQESFDSISSDVAAYFNILECDNDILGDPKIELYSDNDKAVELEIMFGGEFIKPAYKFLSESQINSFGLSIFLASVKRFNSNFKFIILDDVINSFDIYKRPRVIDIISTHFPDYQFLILTHDSIWFDRLQKKFPQWKRMEFSGWDYMIGPRTKPGKSTYERIDESLTNDRPTEAGWFFGRYLEGMLQELCESLEVSVKFKKRNEYTLIELLQAFRSRMEKKLKKDNPIVKQIKDFELESGFRNFCDHWKRSESDYSSSEIREIVQKWKNIEKQIECNECHKFIRYEKNGTYEHISCPCRNTTLT